jgi:hypothetical protein
MVPDPTTCNNSFLRHPSEALPASLDASRVEKGDRRHQVEESLKRILWIRSVFLALVPSLLRSAATS